MDDYYKRLLLTASLFSCTGLFIYWYLYTLLFISIVFFSFWIAYEHIQDNLKENVNPKDKFVFITGCDSGFGLASAKKFRDVGFSVIAGCFDENSAGAKELQSGSAKVDVVALDVSDQNSVSKCGQFIDTLCKGKGLWAVINNSGVNDMGYVEMITMDAYLKTAEINLFGAVRVTKTLLPLIRKAKGRVINVTSERGFNPWPLSSSYCITKFGLEAFSACLRREMEQFDVKVITVAPGNFSGASSITNQAANDSLRRNLRNGRLLLSEEDQKSYPEDVIDSMIKKIEDDRPLSCSSPDPVVDAYLDAAMNTMPRRCYMVTGMARKYLDPTIVCARLRSFLPDRVMNIAVNLVMFVLNREF